MKKRGEVLLKMCTEILCERCGKPSEKRVESEVSALLKSLWISCRKVADNEWKSGGKAFYHL